MTSRRTCLACGVLCAALALGGCASEDELIDGIFTPAEFEVIQGLSPLPPLEDDTTNKYDDNPATAELGQRLFFDPGYSGPIEVGDDGTNGGLGEVGETGKVACVSCHLQDHWFIDSRSNPNNTTLAINWYIRNAPTLVNVATYKEQFGWSGFNDNLWGKNLIPAEFVMGTDRSGIVHYLYQAYREEYAQVFEQELDPALDPEHPEADRFPIKASPLDPEGAWSTMTPEDQDIINRAFANFGKALAAYERLLISDDAPFDRYVAGDKAAISEAAKRGLKLFVGKAACVACHAGPTFTDEEYHVTGVPQIGEHVAKPVDDGRHHGIEIYLSWDFNTAGPYNDDDSIDRTEGVAQTEDTLGAFRTKGLRSVAVTAPFMHTGHLKTLQEAVEFYNDGGASADFAGEKDPLMQPLNLTPEEIQDLVAFLETLTGKPIPEELRRAPEPR